MNVLWLSWKDDRHPEAGGAEIVARELSHRLLADGHTVTLLTSHYPGAQLQEVNDGRTIIRVGSNRYTHPVVALMYYLKHLRGHYDLIVEEVNCAPYFSVFFASKKRACLLYHQLERPVWFYQTKPPLSHIGRYVLEPLATRLISLARTPVVTVSRSTAQDLEAYGFAGKHISIISEGIEIEPLSDLRRVQKYNTATLLSLGAMRAMKRTVDQIQAFELAKAIIPQLKLKLAGNADGVYGQSVLKRIAMSPFKADIDYAGQVSKQEKVELMRRSHIILQTAVHEGWGLTVTEAASQGTPAVAYDVNGLRDSIDHARTGLLTKPNPQALAEGIISLLGQQELYQKMRHAAWQWSKLITFDRSYADFKQALGI